MPTSVMVLGMHRSGTSLVTHSLHTLGLEVPPEDDLLEVADTNEQGFWESKTLMRCNALLLYLSRSAWDYPPPHRQRWAALSDPALRQGLRAAFRSVFPSQSWVWKDPRSCLTAPLWESVLGLRPKILVVLRHPMDVAESLARRDHFSISHGLALWERYMRSAVTAAAGHAVWVTAYDSAVEKPAEWLDDAAEWVGVKSSEPSPVAHPGLRHHTRRLDEALDHPDATPEQRRLHRVLTGLAGIHKTFVAPALPAETHTNDVLFERRRRLGNSIDVWAVEELLSGVASYPRMKLALEAGAAILERQVRPASLRERVAASADVLLRG